MIISASGRLDANWSDYFTESFLGFIRKGEHELVIDAGQLAFLSSAGIRSLIMISKELAKVKGKFTIVNANDFVSNTLQTTGLGTWLSDANMPGIRTKDEEIAEDTIPQDHFTLKEAASMSLSVHSGWKPWEEIQKDRIRKVSFPPDSYALGIGSPLSGERTHDRKFGEFLAICGNLAYQPPEDKSHPDYLMAMENYTPEMLSIQNLYCRGEMAHLLRFWPGEQKTSTGISELANRALELCHSDGVALAVLGEIDGLVGAFMIKSPAEKETGESIDYPGIRDWVSFCGERMFTGEQALIFGIAFRKNKPRSASLLSRLPSNPELAAHMHAVVFPHQPLQNGLLDLKKQIEKFFNGPPPKAMIHLLEDNRPARGLGESSLIRGAMWCSPIKNMEETL